MDFWDYVSSRQQPLLGDTYQHAGCVFQCMLVAAVLGVGLGPIDQGFVVPKK